MLLAKRVKIKTLKKQREYIKKGVLLLPSRGEAGDPSFRYTGYVYPEVVKHFEKEGFDVSVVKSDMVLAATKGKPIYVFTPKEDLVLTPDEKRQAENYRDVQVLNVDKETEAVAETLMTAIFGEDAFSDEDEANQ